jgi:hypothetical protein
LRGGLGRGDSTPMYRDHFQRDFTRSFRKNKPKGQPSDDRHCLDSPIEYPRPHSSPRVAKNFYTIVHKSAKLTGASNHKLFDNPTDCHRHTRRPRCAGRGISALSANSCFISCSIRRTHFPNRPRHDRRGGFFYPPEGKRTQFIPTPIPQPIGAAALAK